MNNFEHGLLFLRLMIYFLIGHELFLIATFTRVYESRESKFMRWSCGCLSAIFYAIGFRATLTYAGRQTFPVDIVLTPLLVLSAIVLAISVYYLIQSARMTSGIRRHG